MTEGKKKKKEHIFCVHSLFSECQRKKLRRRSDLLHDHSGLARSLPSVTQQDHHADEINSGRIHRATCLSFFSCSGWVYFHAGRNAFNHILYLSKCPSGPIREETPSSSGGSLEQQGLRHCNNNLIQKQTDLLRLQRR